MAVNLSALAGAGQQFFDNNGNPLAGGKLWSYQAGTTTPQTTYTDVAGVVAHANPIILDSAGRVATGEIWLTAGDNYKFVLMTSANSTLATWDNITGINGTGITSNASNVSFTGFKSQTGTVSDLADSDGSDWIGFTQAGTGANPISAQDKMRQITSVKDFGAVGDGVTDDTAAIQAALDYCNTWNLNDQKPFLMGAPGTYKISSTLTISCDCDLSSMKIVANASSVSPVVRVGGTVAGEITWRKNVTLPQVENNSRTAGQWGVGVGVQLTNCNTCIITVPQIRFFETGLSCGGLSQGFAYNTVFLQYIVENKINVDVSTNNGGGWANQNVFIGGRLAHTPSLFSGVTNAGSRDIVLGNSNAQANNNLFLNTSIEGTTFPEYSIEFRQKTAYNQFQNCRYEGTAAKQVLFNTDFASGNNSNLIFGGYDASSINYTFTGTGSNSYNSAINGRGNFINSSGVGFNISTGSGSQPHLQGFQAGTTALGKTSLDTDWTYRLNENLLQAKRSGDVNARFFVDFANGGIGFTDGTVAPLRQFESDGSTSFVFIRNTVGFAPYLNNAISLGGSGYRWSEVFAVNGVINTSDKREKQQIRTLSEKEKAVAIRCKSLLRAFKWNDAVEKKGDDARIHFGIIAQDLADAFRAEGLDPDQYSMFCYDKWDAKYKPEIATRDVERINPDGTVYTEKEEYQTGNQVLIKEAGDSYGVRYTELLAFMVAAL